MITIAVLNNKGGVGKTASVTTLAHMITVLHKKRVLVVDLDPQGNTSSLFSKDNFLEIFEGILTGTLEKKEFFIEDALIDTKLDIHKCIRHTEYEGLDIIPSFLTLSEVEERLKADVRTPQQFKLKGHLDKISDEYDYCLIDCSPSLSILNINGLVAADEVYIPTRCDGGSLVGIAITMNLVETVASYNPKLKVAGCFFTQFVGRKNVSKEVYGFLDKILPKNTLLPITIGVTKLLEENSLEQKPLLAMDSGKNKSQATLDYMNLAGYIVSPNKKLFLKQIKNDN